MKRSPGSRKTAKPFIRDPVTASKGKFEIKKLPMLPQIRCVGHIRLSRPCTPLRAAMPFNCLVVQDYTQVQALNGDWQTTQGKRLTAFREAEPDPVPLRRRTALRVSVPILPTRTTPTGIKEENNENHKRVTAFPDGSGRHATTFANGTGAVRRE